MQYRKDRYGNELSVLGFGCMRFPRKGPSIDLEETERELLRAAELGVNYFDTAYIYPGSEEALGKIFERNPGFRDRVYVTGKLPQYLIRSREQMDKILREELARMKTDHIDYYLMHMFTDIAGFENLRKYGFEDWAAEKKQSGRIRQIGFSFHGNSDMFIRILNAYDWDFCQIQYNYLDEVSQAGRKGLEAAAAKGIPVIIMEPLRGGKLVNMLPEEAKSVIAASPRRYSAAEWGLRWLWDQSGVTVVLSGMNSMAMVEENTRIASEAKAEAFTTEDFALIAAIREAIRRGTLVGCTGCRYCMPCPKGVDIPTIFYYYNQTAIEGKMKARFEYAQVACIQKEPGFADKCIRCGKCESHCPQALPIRELLPAADKVLRPLPMKAGLSLARQFMLKRKKS